MTTAAVLSPVNLALVRFFVATATFLMLATSLPAPAEAASLTDTQVKEVVDLLSSYDADPAVIKKVEEVLVQSQRLENKEERPGASACGFLMKNLRRGHQGEDVKQLQEYLKSTGDLSADATGYFGPMTEEALKKVQARFEVVSSGDADSTGFGAFGPRTRAALMERCKGSLDLSDKPDSATNTGAAAAPTCELAASKSEVAEGEAVVLSWTSTNAVYTSQVGGGKGPTEGSIEVELEETTTFIKKVYGRGGVGECTATVEVTGSDDNKRELVWNVQDAQTLTANTFMAVGNGLASAVTAYFGFFGLKF